MIDIQSSYTGINYTTDVDVLPSPLKRLCMIVKTETYVSIRTNE